jgi:hypothetical protein
MQRPRCKFGEPCDRAGGFGTFGSFCSIHAKRLAEIDMSRTQRAAVREVRRKPEPGSGSGAVAPDAAGRWPLAERTKALGRLVWAAGEPVSQVAAAEGLGLASAKGSLARIVFEAREKGYLAARAPGSGRGYTPGSVEPPPEASQGFS